MKLSNIILITIFILSFSSCYKPGKVQIENNISNVELIDVKWGDIYISYQLYPGETSEKIEITKQDEKLPSKNRVTFKMRANLKTVYLKTEEEYMLDQDEELYIILNDDTKVLEFE